MMNNRQLADTFTLIANLLEIKGEIIYKTLAYRKASESLMGLGRQASDYWKEGKLRGSLPKVNRTMLSSTMPPATVAISQALDPRSANGRNRTRAVSTVSVVQGTMDSSHRATWVPLASTGRTATSSGRPISRVQLANSSSTPSGSRK